MNIRTFFLYKQIIFLAFCFLFSMTSFCLGSSFHVNRKAIGIHESFDLKQILSDNTSSFLYTSSDPTIAIVNQDGIVTGISQGNTTITIEDSNHITSTLQVTVGYYLGIDVSTHNGTLDFEKIKKEGIDFLMIRSSYGWYDEKDQENGKDYSFQYDKELKNNVEGALNHQIPFGIYHYSYASTKEEALLEAEYTINALKEAGITSSNLSLPIAYDVEENTSLDKETITDLVITYCTKIKEAGFTPMIYSYENWYSSHLNMKRLNALGYQFWYANYPKNPDFSTMPHIANTSIVPFIWQYSNQGSILGANTPNHTVDLNILYMANMTTISFVQDGNTIHTQTIHKGFYPNLPTPKKEGYQFKGWKYSNGNFVQSNDLFFKDTTLTAYFEPDLSLRSIQFLADKLYLKENSTYPLKVKFTPENTIDDTSLNFTSSDETIASVNENGILTTKKQGTVKIIATSKQYPNLTTTCQIIISHYLKGDKNMDDKIDVTDAYLLLQDIATNHFFSEEELERMDLDNDRYITVTDAYLLLTMILKYNS